MKHRLLRTFVLLLVTSQVAASHPMIFSRMGPQPSPPSDKQTEREKQLEQRDRNRNGIVVGEPKVYDDALLQRMLNDTEAQLAQVKLLDAGEILKRLGSVSGAEQSISSFGLNLQGPSLPGITTKTSAAGNEQTVTVPQANPPAATAPAATTSLPSSFSVSASDILNEQMQLSFEVVNLRLLLAGSLSDYFVKVDPSSQESFVKLKTTLGFPLTITPDKRYKDAVAIVEVEVEKLSHVGLDERPAITALLPREKTYNVASITDSSTSIQGGVVTQVVGVGGSWLRGHKTYYLVQDQDTLALSYQPENPKWVGFRWEFRPVLGRSFVKAGQKNTFVQIAFPAPSDAKEGEIGKLHIRTYWRRYDHKKGIVKEIIPNSLSESTPAFNIPRYSLSPPVDFDNANLEDLGNGQILVRIAGRFLPGTFVRVGATIPASTMDYSGIRFTASASDLATKKIALVSYDGTELPLQMEHMDVSPVRLRPVPSVMDHQVKTIDDTNSLVTVKLANRSHITEEKPPLVMVIGGRVFGYSDAPIQRDKDNQTLSATVPTALLIANPEVTIKPLFAPTRTSCPPSQAGDPAGPCLYEAKVRLTEFDFTSRGERLVLLGQGKDSKGKDVIKFLLQGSRLKDARVIEPSTVNLEDVGRPEDRDTLRAVSLTADQVKAYKYLLIKRKDKRQGYERPFLVAIPPLETKPPKPPEAKERVTVNADEAVIEGEGMKDLVSVKFNDTVIPFVLAKDGKSVTLKGLQSRGVTATATTQPLELEFKEGKATVKLEIVSSKVETVSK